MQLMHENVKALQDLINICNLGLGLNQHISNMLCHLVPFDQHSQITSVQQALALILHVLHFVL